MNRTLPYLLLFIAYTVIGNCQESALSITPKSVEESFTVDLNDPDLDLELITTISNESAEDTLFLKWERSILDTPLEWQTQVCDNNLCYDPGVSSNFDGNVNAPVFLEPNSSFELIFHVLPNQTAGIGQFQLVFSRTDESEVALDTINFVASVSDLTTSDDDYLNERANLSVYPNPTNEYFHLTNPDLVDEIIVYSMLGRKVKTFSTRFNNQNQFDVTDLSEGLYLLSLINYDKGVIKTLRLSKRTYRP